MDINKDSWPDLVVAANSFDTTTGPDTGRVYLISGQYMHIKTGKELLDERKMALGF